jgi:HAD superfamily hydrolase (TIGR01450 family)
MVTGTTRPAVITVQEAITRHRVFLIDNFGVLRTSSGPIPGVGKALKEIQAQGKRAIVLTNTANSLPEQLADDISHMHGLKFSPADVVTSGMALKPYFVEKELVGKHILTVGNVGTVNYVVNAGGRVLGTVDIFNRLNEIEGVVIGWYPTFGGTNPINFLISNEQIQAAINALRLSKGLPGVIANTDVTVPYDARRVIYGCGALGNLIEQCAGRPLDRLGKPYRPIYDFAFSLVPGVNKDEILMVGDSLEYDVLGARNAGIKSLLVMTGNTRTLQEINAATFQPDYIAPAFTLD